MSSLPPILQVGDVLLSSDIITEKFCCDLALCKGRCCIEGEAGAPVSMDEILAIEEVLDTVWNDLSASAQAVIDKTIEQTTIKAIIFFIKQILLKNICD